MSEPHDLHPFPNWVPQEIITGYKNKGVNGLFQWQADVVSRADLQHNKNLVYSAPTSAGKSIVAELLALRVALSGKRVLFVLPYISVAKEKLTFIQRLWRLVDVQVAGFIGANSAPSRDWTAAVCTIEKANSLINHAIIDGTMEQYGLIVLDELHMVADSSRGATLEALTTKILHYNQSRIDQSAFFRIIGMSATVPNLDRIGSWLDAQVEETSFRPIALLECIGCEGVVRDATTYRELRRLPQRFRYQGDSDGTIGFSVEAVAEGKQTLVFCSSKTEVEKIAFEVARILASEYKSSPEMTARLEEHREAHWAMKTELEQTCRQLDPTLAKTLPRGVAYHHAGLTAEERECIENSFREGHIFVLVATSTLSSGVNLPANRVVIKAQVRGPAALHTTSYKQMSGRAGRLGHTDEGESILVSRACDLEQVRKLIKLPLDRGNQKPRDPSKVVSEGICSGLTGSMSSVSGLMSQLLYPVSKTAEQIVCDLAGHSLITRSENDEISEDEDIQLSATQLGRAALASSLPPEAALFVFSDLQLAARALSVDTELHMLYLVTPANCSVWQGCDWNHLYTIFSQLDSNTKRVAKLIGANERFLLARLQGKSVLPSDRQLQLHLRFFSALTLFDLVSEKPLSEVAERFRISRGTLQALQQQSATYAVMVVAFCARLGWQYIKALLEGFASRLAFGIRAELTELVRVDGIDGSRARVFHEHEITSLSQLAQCTVKEVSTVLSLAVPFESSNMNDGRCEWLSGEDRMTLQEAADCLISRAHEAVKERIRQMGFDIGDFVKVAHPQPSSEVTEKPPTQSTRTATQRRSQKITLETQSSTDTHAGFSDAGLGCSVGASVPDTGGVDATQPTLDTGYESQRRRSVAMSTPLAHRVPPRPSLSCSRIDESAHEYSMDLFSDSLLELSLDENMEVVSASTSSAEDVVNSSIVLEENVNETGEIDALETSLLNLTRQEDERVETGGDAEKENDPVFKDSFDCTVSIGGCKAVEARRRSALSVIHDSFDDTVCVGAPLNSVANTRPSLATRLSFGSVPRHSSPLARVSSQDIKIGTPPGVSSPINTSCVDLFDSPSPVATAKLQSKRNRLSSQFWSPSVSSPLGKVSRLAAPPVGTGAAATIFPINDVCGSEARWDAFVARSHQWQTAAMALVTSGTSSTGSSVVAVALCSQGSTPDFVPLTEDYFPGSSMEEALCPSSTPCQSVSIPTRIAHLERIFGTTVIYCYDALRQCAQLRADHGLEVLSPVCLSYLSFLAMLRVGDAPMPLMQLAAKFDWDFDMMALLRMNARVKAAAQAFIVGRLFDRIRSQAVRVSSEESVQLEIASIKVVSSMSLNGFPFRSAACASVLSQIRERMNVLETECHKLAGRSFNLDSATQVSEVLFTRLRLPYPGGAATSKKHLATNKTILKQLTAVHPIVDKILQFRKLKHAVTQCLLPLSSCVHADDVIRTTFEICTSTGRLLSHHPNIQNVPKGDILDGFCVRSLFTARDGYTLLAADYCQLELRVLAHLSNDVTLLKRLADDDRDFFSDLSVQWGFDRDAVKQMCYGIIYGMGVRSLAEATKTSLDQAQRLSNTFFSTFPKVRSYINNTKEKAARDGFVLTMLGRRRIACVRGRQEERAHDDRQSVNFTIQGTASEIFKKAIINITEGIRDRDARIVMTVHDEVIIECHSTISHQIRDVIRDAMQHVFPDLRVPLRVKIAGGPDWGHLTK